MTGNPSLTGISVNLPNLVTDHLNDPIQVENFRRAMRSWFAAYTPGFDTRFGPFDLEGSFYAYEVLDELLSAYVQLAANPVQS